MFTASVNSIETLLPYSTKKSSILSLIGCHITKKNPFGTKKEKNNSIYQSITVKCNFHDLEVFFSIIRLLCNQRTLPNIYDGAFLQK